MKVYTIGALIAVAVLPAYGNPEKLSMAINNAADACANISESMGDIESVAKINTVITGVGTMAGGIGVTTGIKKSKTDKDYSQLQAFEKDNSTNKQFAPNINEQISEFSAQLATKTPEELNAMATEMEAKSKKAGNLRTGMMAANTATNIAGTIIAASNKPSNDIKQQVADCLTAVGNLQSEKMQSHVDGIKDTDPQMQIAQNIIDNCGKYNPSDLDSLINKSTGAIIAGSIGIATGGAGTATSIAANSKSVRSDNTEAGNKKEKNLNTASNILGASATGASAVMTIFNATQISAAKKIMNTAYACEGAFK